MNVNLKFKVFFSQKSRMQAYFKKVVNMTWLVAAHSLDLSRSLQTVESKVNAIMILLCAGATHSNLKLFFYHNISQDFFCINQVK